MFPVNQTVQSHILFMFSCFLVSLGFFWLGTFSVTWYEALCCWMLLDWPLLITLKLFFLKFSYLCFSLCVNYLSMCTLRDKWSILYQQWLMSLSHHLFPPYSELTCKRLWLWCGWSLQVIREGVHLPHPCSGEGDAIPGHPPAPHPVLHPCCCRAELRDVHLPPRGQHQEAAAARCQSGRTPLDLCR